MKNKVIGAKPTSATPMIAIPVASNTKVCRMDRFDPKNELKMNSVGMQITVVSRNRIGSLRQDERACKKTMLTANNRAINGERGSTDEV